MIKKVEYAKWDDCNRVSFYCPGCGRLHSLPVDGNPNEYPIWNWNNSEENPTITPSILMRTTDWVNGDKNKVENIVCHSYVTEGKIRFLKDCTHSLKGMTVDLPEIKEPIA